MKAISFFGALAFIVLAPLAASANSAVFSAEGPAEVRPGAEFELRIMLSSDLPLNAYDVSVRYPADLLEIVRFDDSNSAINVWQGQPTILAGGEFSFAGGSTKPVTGKNELLTVRMKGVREGSARLAFETAEGYIANGKGTPAGANAESLLVSISSAAALIAEGGEQPDAEPPQIDFLSLESDPFNPEQKLLAFSVRDADSGIKESRVRYRTFVAWSDWQRAQNPIAVPASAWAVAFETQDNFGNPIATVVYYWPAFWRNILPWVAILAVIGAALAWRRRRRKLM